MARQRQRNPDNWPAPFVETIYTDDQRAELEIDQVDNTPDADKPVSAPQQDALDDKAPLASPALTGTPTAPTAALGTNTTQVATTAFVRAEAAAIVDSAPGTLDTLNELAAALGDDPNFATTVATALAERAITSSGTWTPTYGGSVGDPTISYSVQTGLWRRVGPLVFASGEISGAVTLAGTGSLLIEGLPVAALTGAVAVISIGYATGFAATKPVAGYVGGSGITLTYDPSATARTECDVATTLGAGVNYLAFSIVYPAA